MEQRRQVGIVGLGRIGSALARLEKGYPLAGYNRTREKTERLVESGLTPVWSLPELAD